MDRYSHAHLSRRAQLDGARAAARSESSSAAELISYLAEIECSKAYLEEAYGSLHAWCMGELNLCEQAAYRRIGAARYARDYPALFPAVADGRLHLTAVTLIGPHLTPETADQLIAAAAGQSCARIKQLLAERDQPDLLAPAESLPAADPPAVEDTQLSSTIVAGITPAETPVQASAPAPVINRVPLPAVPRTTYEKLRYLKSLLGHQVPSGDLAEVLDRVCDVAIRQIEKRRFGATDRPRRGARKAKPDSRHIPAEITRTVWERDGGRCTFTGADGRRCEATTRLEFDHIAPFAKGVETTVNNVRLLCQAHNQFEAERAYGQAFMDRKREQARDAQRKRATRTTSADRAKAAPPPADPPATEPDPECDVTPWLRHLDYGAKDAKQAAEHCERMAEATLEDRMRAALTYLAPLHRKIAAPTQSPA